MSSGSTADMQTSAPLVSCIVNSDMFHSSPRINQTSVWLIRGLEWNISLLTMQLTSGAEVCISAVEPEDIFNRAAGW